MAPLTRRFRFGVGLATVLLVAGCGGSGKAGDAASSSTKAPPSLSVADGCTTPATYTFTDAQARVAVTGGSHKGENFDLQGIANPGFETRSDRPNNDYDPTAWDGEPWTQLTIGSTDGKGLVIEIEGVDPCDNPTKSGYAATLYGSDDTSRFGGPCDVTVEAFNGDGIKGTWDCKGISQFGFDDNPPSTTAHGTFVATGR